MGNARVGVEQALHVCGGRGLILGGFKGAETTAQHVADVGQAFAVCAINQHQHIAIAWNQSADCRFHGERAAALQRNTMVAAGAVDNGQQLFAQAGRQSVEAVIP